MNDYDLELDRVVAQVKKAKARRVGLQFPEGLKDMALDVARQVEARTSATVIVMADPTYGACDIKRGQARKLGVDLLVHFGHTEF
jgi:2-(3-amino-3-carboxypropyl)histidine synthase